MTQNERDTLDAYLKINNIDCKPTSSGLYYVSLSEGKGEKPLPGQRVFIKYKTYLLDGKLMDASPSKYPFPFILGAGHVVAGLDQGIGLMSVGGKARLILPSSLAYGNDGYGDIPPASPLVIDVELVSVK